MPEWSTLGLFFVASLVLLVTPGPAVLYIVARSIDQGRVAGVVSVLGVSFGTLFHVGAAALGISALLVSSALAFNVVKYLGAAYLVYLGVRKLRERDTPLHLGTTEPRELSRIFYEGTLVNLLNPKTALFFFAFLPQFVDPARGPVAVQIVLLGAIMVAMGVCSDGAYALLAGTVGHWLKSSARFLRGQRYLTGGIYMTLGIMTAFGGSHSK
jgi:threonine/homoserine/homoserine lactone efflux protein